MANGKKTVNNEQETDFEQTRSHAKTAEGREAELIALAYNRVEDRIRNNQATGPELVHFLKLGSTKGKLEKEILEKEKELVTAKTESLRDAKSREEMYTKAIEAMQSYRYGGSGEDE